MQRRKFIAGLGSLAAAGAAGIGTGAFTSVEADRTVDVQVKGDASAYLGLKGSGDSNAQYVSGQSNGEIKINFDKSGNGGSGVNPNADTTLESVFQIENQGTQAVEVDLSGSGLTVQDNGSISAPGSDGIAVALAKDDGDSSSDDTYELGTGESVDVDFAINSGTSALSGTLTIEADA